MIIFCFLNCFYWTWNTTEPSLTTSKSITWQHIERCIYEYTLWVSTNLTSVSEHWINGQLRQYNKVWGPPQLYRNLVIDNHRFSKTVIGAFDLWCTCLQELDLQEIDLGWTVNQSQWHYHSFFTPLPKREHLWAVPKYVWVVTDHFIFSPAVYFCWIICKFLNRWRCL